MKGLISPYKKFTLAVFAAAMLLVPNACQKDKLEQLPLNQFGQAVIFDTPDRFVSLLNGIYDAAKNGWLFGSRSIVYGDIRANDFLNELTNVVTGFSVYNHTQTESDNAVNQVWIAAYYAINSANIYIDGVERNKSVLGANAETLSKQYIAEARLIRALMYHLLVNFYAQPYANNQGNNPGVPLRLRPETEPGNNDLARSSVAEVYNQILEDLNYAEANLASTNGSALLNTTRAHKNTAIALKVRVLMGMQRYADVITEANKIVPQAAPFAAATGVAHALQANVRNVFATPYTTTESILSFPFTTNDLPGTQNGLVYYWAPTPRGNGEYSLNPAGIIADSVAFAGADARRSFNIIHTNNKPYLNKFATGPEALDYAPVIRYAEVLLHLSEAIARTEGVTQRAVDLLNAVRTRSNPAGAYGLNSFATADELINAILTEMRIEFLGEGLRSYTLQRLLLPLPGKGNVATIPSDSPDYIWPIPQTELAVNKLMTSNP